MALLAHYRMDDNSASTFVQNIVTGTLSGNANRNTNLMTTGGVFLRALNFTGSTDFVRCSGNFNSHQAVTVACWFKKSFNNGDQKLGGNQVQTSGGYKIGEGIPGLGLCASQNEKPRP